MYSYNIHIEVVPFVVPCMTVYFNIDKGAAFVSDSEN